MTIIASLIGVAVEHEANDLMGWTPPPITIVWQMSPSQMDELSHQIIQQLEQMHQRQAPLAGAGWQMERAAPPVKHPGRRSTH